MQRINQEEQSFKLISRYLLYTFSITWVSWLIIIIGNTYFNTLLYGTPLFWIPYTIGSLGPAISAYLIYRQFKEDFAEQTFIKYIFGKKINREVWLIFGLLLGWRLFMIWISFGIQKPISILSLLINVPFVIVLGGLEEVGWRGILQPKVEKVMTYLPSVLAVGVIWTLWHLPLWFIHGTAQSGISFGWYLVSGIVLTSNFTTLYKYTNNLFLCILSHAWFNICIGMALYVGNNGVLELNVNWKVILVFSIEFIVSVLLGVVYVKKVKNTNGITTTILNPSQIIEVQP
jgi:membrane protease YdiL (CAAX protease family)